MLASAKIYRDFVNDFHWIHVRTLKLLHEQTRYGFQKCSLTWDNKTEIATWTDTDEPKSTRISVVITEVTFYTIVFYHLTSSVHLVACCVSVFVRVRVCVCERGIGGCEVWPHGDVSGCMDSQFIMWYFENHKTTKDRQTHSDNRGR